LRFESLNAQVLGISGDSLKNHKKFTERHGISFPLISDKDKTIRRQYGGGRTTYLIDMKGTIRFIKKGIPDNEELLAELRRLNGS
jgi:peroxiredoxin Q/BCP